MAERETTGKGSDLAREAKREDPRKLQMELRLEPRPDPVPLMGLYQTMKIGEYLNQQGIMVQVFATGMCTAVSLDCAIDMPYGRASSRADSDGNYRQGGSE